jgi:transposase
MHGMEITPEQYERIEDCLPVQRGNVKTENLVLLNAILYVAEQGCKWRGLPKRFGKWHSVYTRMNRWAKRGVLDRVFAKLQEEQILQLKIEAFSLDSTSVKVHPDGTGALKKTARKPLANREGDGIPKFIWLPRMRERPSHSVCRPDKTTMAPSGDSCCSHSDLCQSKFRW